MLAEYGIVIAKGKSAFRAQMANILEDAENELSMISRELFSQLREEFIEIENKLSGYDKQIQQENKINIANKMLSSPTLAFGNDRVFYPETTFSP